MIVDDSSGEMLDEHGQMWLDAIELSDHRVTIIRGARINQAYSHNRVLWSQDANEYIFRVDDDVRLQPDFLENLVLHWTELESAGHNIGGVGGVYFTEHLMPRDENPPIPTSNHDFTSIEPDGTLGPWAQMRSYSDDEPFLTEHLYSSYLYKRDAMRAVGGFPLVYSVGVSYHEETDASYRLHLAEYEMFVIPSARGVHSHDDTGGTRLMPGAEHKRRAESDWELFLKRLPRLRGVNYKPSIALYSDHWKGIGGGQRLTYCLAEALVSSGLFGAIDVVHPPHEQVESAEFVLEHYGLDLRGHDAIVHSPVEGHDWGEIEYDVVISLGHSPPSLSAIPPRRHHIHYSLYPVGEAMKGVDRYVAISKFSAGGVLKEYRRNAEVVYPYVKQDVKPGDVVKENLVLVVGRLAGKAVGELAHSFLSMDLPDDSRLVIVMPGDDEGKDSSRLGSLAQHPRIDLLTDVTSDELDDLYLRAKILWAARGYGLPERPAVTNREHFGYTPVEALSRYCLPVAFAAGGYVETTTSLWSNRQELCSITEGLMGSREIWEETLGRNLALMGQFSRGQFALDWIRVVASTNALAWQSSVENRRVNMPDLSVTSNEVHLAVIAEHPLRSTGYGVVSREVLRGLVNDGINVHLFALDDATPDVRNEFASLWPNPKGGGDHENFLRFISHRVFDAALVMYDPVISMRYVNSISSGAYKIPTVAFVSQEGLPPSAAWESICQKAEIVITYCETGAKAIEEKYGRKVDWVYLGVDHAPFERYDDEDRQALRKMLGWESKFVIMNVARNARNKRIAELIKIVAILRDKYDHDDLILFLHTQAVPDDPNMFHGIDVGMYAKMVGIPENETIVISPQPRGGVPYETDLDQALGLGMPTSTRAAGKWLRDKIGMIGRYNLADLYVDISSAEGHGLPTFEAMACGVPVLSVDDGFVRTEIIDHHWLLSAHKGSVWITGADLMDVELWETAHRIHEIKKLGRKVFVGGDDARAIADRLKWDNVRDKIREAIEQCLR
jgi:glycosyltransferase involved in cell wall biosynthesis